MYGIKAGGAPGFYEPPFFILRTPEPELWVKGGVENG